MRCLDTPLDHRGVGDAWLGSGVTDGLGCWARIIAAFFHVPAKCAPGPPTFVIVTRTRRQPSQPQFLFGAINQPGPMSVAHDGSRAVVIASVIPQCTPLISQRRPSPRDSVVAHIGAPFWRTRQRHRERCPRMGGSTGNDRWQSAHRAYRIPQNAHVRHTAASGLSSSGCHALSQRGGLPIRSSRSFIGLASGS